MIRKAERQDVPLLLEFKRLSHLPLKVTAVTETSGISIIEAVERTDKPFFVGLQYHPEMAVAKHASGAADASRFMDYEDALCYFRALVKQGEQKHQKQ